jgi:hypothetical protein
MLLVTNLPQPVGLTDNGNANAREARSQLEASRRAQRQGLTASRSHWLESV